MTTLDIGCGNYPKGDINLDIDKKRYREAWLSQGNHGWFFGDGVHLPFQDGVFNKIYCTVALPYVQSEQEVIKEIHRVLTSDGIILVSHHLLVFYIKCLFRDPKRIIRDHTNKIMRKITYPYVRVVEIAIKIMIFTIFHNIRPNKLPTIIQSLVSRMALMQTPNGLKNLALQNNLRLISLEVRKRYHQFPQMIDITCVKEL